MLLNINRKQLLYDLMTTKKDHPFKNTQMPLTQRIAFSGIRLSFKVLGIISPSLAGRLALRLFMTPTRFRTPRKEKVLRESATLKFITVRDRKIAVRTWGDENAPTVLLSHGWGGRCTQFHAFIPPLLEAGYRIVGFDVPAHGDSEGKRTNMMDVASVISEITKDEGPIEAIIGHSFGTGTALLSIDKYQIETKKIILIACFSDVIWITDLFGEAFDLRKSTLEAMRKIALKEFKHTYGIQWTWQDISPLETIKRFKGELLFIHDKNDHEVPYEQGKRLQNVAPHAQVMTTSGYGHRKILIYKKVVETTLEFIKS